MRVTKPDSVCKKCYNRNPSNHHRCFKNIRVIRQGVDTNVSARKYLSKDGLSCKYFQLDKTL